MTQSSHISLLEALNQDDEKQFRYILETEGLTQDGHWYDYDLLVRALRLHRKRMVNYLLGKSCRVNKPLRLSTNTNTPLHMVAEKLGWCKVAVKMLKLKARVTDVNADGNTPLHLAFINHQSNQLINLLLKHYLKESNEDIHNKDGLGFMHIACTRADLRSIQDFFDVGMSDVYSKVLPNSKSIYAGYSPLHFAVQARRHQVVEFLCKWEADVYAQDQNRSTPLHLALEKQDAQIIDILFYYDAKYENYVNDFGVSHFMAACAGSDPTVVEQYISIAEEDPLKSLRDMTNGQVKDILFHPNAGYTPLHFACEYGRFCTVFGLLMAGATPQYLSTNGLTPHNVAAKREFTDICDLFEQFYSGNLNKIFPRPQFLVQIKQQPKVCYKKCTKDVMSDDDLAKSCESLQIV